MYCWPFWAYGSITYRSSRAITGQAVPRISASGLSPFPHRAEPSSTVTARCATRIWRTGFLHRTTRARQRTPEPTGRRWKLPTRTRIFTTRLVSSIQGARLNRKRRYGSLTTPYELQQIAAVRLRQILVIPHIPSRCQAVQNYHLHYLLYASW